MIKIRKLITLIKKKLITHLIVKFSKFLDYQKNIYLKETKIIFDECFGINIDFNRKSYTEDNLKPQDILTIMFSFKNVGSYKSTNLAVSENDKQDIQWENFSVNKEKFDKIQKNKNKLFINNFFNILYCYK